ncbi:MAG: hypothetical protein WC705_03310 [Candidatus Paceibacterota bacterium]|jgi:hypothetical protein
MEIIKTKEFPSAQSLIQAYEIIHGKRPKELEDWQIAQLILEALDDPRVPLGIAQECIYLITNVIKYPDDETRIGIVSMAEDLAGDFFSTLKNQREIHMADIEREYFASRG